MMWKYSREATLLAGAVVAVGVSLAQQPKANSSLLDQGSAAMQRGDLAGAETAFRQAATTHPNAEAFMGLGLVMLREGKPREAVTTLTKASQLNPRLGGAHLFLGVAQYQLGLASDAVDNLRAELALDPSNAEASTWLTMVLLALDQGSAAVPVIDRAVAAKPADAQLLYLQAKVHGAVVKEALGRLYQMDPDSALVHRAMAESLASSGDTEKAIVEYQAAIRREPNSPDLLEALGDEEQQAGHAEAAAAAFEQELKINPNSPVALYELGHLEVEHGKAEDGVALLRRAQAAHAAGSPTEYYLGLGLAEMGQNEEAARWLQASLEHNPSAFVRRGAWFQLARVYGKLNRKAEQEDALTHLKQISEAQSQAGAHPAGTQEPASPGAAQSVPRQP